MRVAIIGAGAAGMMCAATLIEQNFGWEIHLFDKNKKIWEKVAITGGGRCNVTTGLRDRKKLLSKYIRGWDFLDFAMRKFSPLAVFKWFESHGVALKIEQDNRVFPQSNKSADVIWLFENIFLSGSVIQHLWEWVQNVMKTNVWFSLVTSSGEYPFDVVVIATWGNAYQHTWSTWDAYAWAQSMWHHITNLGPSLSSFVVEEKWLTELSGISFPYADFMFWDKTISGPMLFTHWWISWPLTFELSAHLAYEEVDPVHTYAVKINFYTDKKFDFWNKLLIDKSASEQNKLLKNILYDFFPKRFVDLFLQNIFPEWTDLKMTNMKKEDRKKLAHLLSGEFPVTLIWRKPGDEFVTAGGVDLSEIDPKTMQSLLIPNLYFAGEVVDVDWVTWWFNLQSSWAMGRLIALHLLDKS